MSAAPRLTRTLGWAGLAPQVAAVAALYAGPESWFEPAIFIALAYAALILTFLGGTWWGILASAPAAERRGTHGWAWVMSVVPSLIALGCFALLALGAVPAEPLLVTLGSGLLLSPLVDGRLKDIAPPWWMGLRVPLSLGLGGLTVAAALA